MKKLVLLLTVLLLFACQKKGEKPAIVERSFYAWKDSYYLSDITKNELSNLKTKKIYCKLFEVDYNDAQGNFPYEKNRPDEFYGEGLDSLEIVPTIFIKNGIFQYNNEKSLHELADNIVFLIDKYTQKKYKEIQIDCDWTKSTKDKYFLLLKNIKNISGKKVSCTLRLYPYAYPDVMGVPPVDSVTLMCYNLISPFSNKNKNSILDLNELEKYVKIPQEQYPVHLDIALPVFYWTHLYHNNQFQTLLELNSKEVKAFAKQKANHWYEIQKDTTIGYYTYLKKGDQIKVEEVTTDDLDKAIDLLKKYVPFESKVTITLFDLDQSTFKQYSDEELDRIYNRLLQ